MDLKQKYREENNKEPYNKTKTNVYIKTGSYSDEYVKWLERKLNKNNITPQREVLKCAWCTKNKKPDNISHLCDECFKKGCENF